MSIYSNTIQLFEKAATVLAAPSFMDLEEFFDMFGQPAGQKLWASVATRLGLSPDIQLDLVANGSNGAQGLVYKLPDGHALKLSKPATAGMRKAYNTDPEAEIKACAIIMGNPYPSVVQIFDVFKIKSKQSQGFGIVMETLEPMDHKFQVPFSTLSQYLIQQELTPERVTKAASEILKQQIIEPSEMKPFKEAVSWLADVAQYLQTVGIKYLDLHAGNVMMRDGELVLIDFGLSRSPNQQIDLLEARRAVLP